MSMSFADKMSSGKLFGAQIHVIIGDNGVGKTTWATSFPNSLIVDLENGSRHIVLSNDKKRLSSPDVPNFETFKQLLVWLKTQSFKVVIIDSIESLEAMIFDSICKEGSVDSIEQFEGGWGKGFTRAREVMREIMVELQCLRSVGITSILVGHTQTKSKTDPATNQTWDRVIMRCNDKMGAVVRDLSDNVFYCTHKVFTSKDNGKTTAFSDGQRVMFTQWRSGFDAKNRLDLPLEIPLSYDAFIEACESKPSNSNELIEDIQQMAEGVDESLKAKVKEQLQKFKNNPEKLKELKNRLMKYVTA